jgi:hypothetical protein
MSYNNLNLALNLSSANYTINHAMYTRSKTNSYMNFCTTCKMYDCYHLNPVTPHVYHHANCGCMMRNAGTHR